MWEVDHMRNDLVGTDLMGVDFVGIDLMGGLRYSQWHHPPTRDTSRVRGIGERGGCGICVPRTAGRPVQLGEKCGGTVLGYLRATGSKTDRTQTLHFLPPSQFKRGVDRYSPVDNSSLSQSYPRGGLRVCSVEFGDKMTAGRRHLRTVVPQYSTTH